MDRPATLSTGLTGREEKFLDYFDFTDSPGCTSETVLLALPNRNLVTI